VAGGAAIATAGVISMAVARKVIRSVFITYLDLGRNAAGGRPASSPAKAASGEHWRTMIAMASRNAPLGGFLFGFKITSGPLQMDSSQGTAFFRQISGLKSETEVQDFNEGGNTAFTRKLVGGRKWPNLVLKQGFTGDIRLFKWKLAPERVNGAIIQLGPDMKEVCRWEFVKGYPVKWEGPDLDASKNEIAIESIEIAHEGLKLMKV